MSDILPGISMTFVESPRKHASYKIGEVIFDKKQYTLEDAQDFWTDFQIYCVDKKYSLNKKFPSIEFACDIDGGYIVFGCYRNITEYEPKEFLKTQLQQLE